MTLYKRILCPYLVYPMLKYWNQHFHLLRSSISHPFLYVRSLMNRNNNNSLEARTGMKKVSPICSMSMKTFHFTSTFEVKGRLITKWLGYDSMCGNVPWDD